MSVKIMSRVWEESPVKGSALIVLLALADWSNDRGVCWPSVSTLAKKARISRRQAIRILKDLEDSGEIVSAPRVTGDQKQLSNIYRLVAYVDGGGGDKMSPVTSGGGDIDVTGGGDTDVTGGGDTDVTGGGDIAMSHDPSVRSINKTHKEDPAPVAPAAQATPEKDHPKLMRLYHEALGYAMPSGAQEASGAKKILKAGYTPEEAVACYQWLKSDPFWGDKHLSLQSVFKQLGPWAQAGRPKTKGQNGANVLAQEISAKEADRLNEKRLASKLGAGIN